MCFVVIWKNSQQINFLRFPIESLQKKSWVPPRFPQFSHPDFPSAKAYYCPGNRQGETSTYSSGFWARFDVRGGFGRSIHLSNENNGAPCY